MFPFSEKILSELEEFDRLKQQRFTPGQQVLITGNGQRSLNSYLSSGYRHFFDKKGVYFVVGEESNPGPQYEGQGRLYIVKDVTKNDFTQSIFAFDLKPAFNSLAKPRAILENGLPNI